MTLLRTFITLVDGFNYRIGRIIMFGIFAMMAVLLWSTISKFMDQPSLWTLEVAQFAMIAYFCLGGPYAIQMGSHVRMDLFTKTGRRRKRRVLMQLWSFACLLI